MHLHRLAQGDDPRAARAAASGSATCSTGSPSTSRCACTAASASRSARSTRCTGRPEFEYAEIDIRDLLHEKDTARRVDVDGAAAAGASTHNAEPAKEIDAAHEGRLPSRSRPARPTGERGAVVPLADRRRGPASSCSGVVAVGSAFLVVTTQHLVHAALWLVVTLGAVAGCYLLLTAEFVAWVQVLIYVGAVVVLLLFALMLTRAPIGRLRRPDRPQTAGSRWSSRLRRPAVLVTVDGRRRSRRRTSTSASGTRPWPATQIGCGGVPLLGAAVRGAVGAAARRAGRRDRALAAAPARGVADMHLVLCRSWSPRCCSRSGSTACSPGATRSWC